MNSQEIRTIVRAEIVPLLRKVGFKGSYPHLHREYGDYWQYWSFYAHYYGETFYSECAIWPKWIKLEWFGRNLINRGFEKLDATYCEGFLRFDAPDESLRINPKHYTKDQRDKIQDLFIPAIKEGLAWLEDHSSVNGVKELALWQLRGAPSTLWAHVYACMCELKEGELDEASKRIEVMRKEINRPGNSYSEFIKQLPDLLERLLTIELKK